ncbi:MAG: phytoene desaturase [Beijerinckiaceae bacterium]|nr:phytoene desaturase [Beijerinckiaceae bacterium]
MRKAQSVPRIAVIGAGPGGLATAMLLAKAGVDVTVYEKDPVVGGRTKVFADGDFRFDIGPTFFLYPQILESVFSRCGLRMDDYLTLRRVDPSYCLAFEGGPSIRVSSNIDDLEAQIATLSVRDSKNIRRFIEVNRRKLAAFKPILERPFLSMLDYLAPTVLKSLHWLFPFSSVDTELSKYFEDPRVRLAFSFQTKYLGMSPFRCPNLFTFLSFLEYEFGIWHPVGGNGAVSEAMAKAARDLGVTFRMGEAVEAVEFNGDAVSGVRTKGGVSPAEATVINADFAEAITTLVPEQVRKRWSNKKVESMKYSCSTFMLYLGVEGGYDLDHHTIFLSQNYEENIRQIESGDVVPTQPSIYVCNPARTDPAFAKNGRSSIYVLVPVGHCGAIDWSKETQSFRNTIIQRLETLGLKGLSERIVYERIVTPENWREDFSIYRGATFNLAHGLDQMLYFRPHNRLEDAKGLYVAGGGTHPGSGLPVIYEGARITADLLLADFGLKPATGTTAKGGYQSSTPSSLKLMPDPAEFRQSRKA